MVENAQEAVAIMAHQFYDEPSTRVKLVGVTGTNGKTTVATLLYKLFFFIRVYLWFNKHSAKSYWY